LLVLIVIGNLIWLTLITLIGWDNFDFISDMTGPNLIKFGGSVSCIVLIK
jgi:hypothetical protein